MSKKYQMVFDDLKAKIQSSEYKNGDKLPSENMLMNVYGVSRQTIRQALAMLEKEGMLEKSQGKGSFVRKNAARVSTKRIAVITLDIGLSVFPPVLKEVEEVMFSHGYATMLFSTQSSVLRERRILQQLIENPVDGIIMYATMAIFGCENLDLFRILMDMGTKFVFMDTKYADPELSEIPCVSMEDRQGAYEVTSRILRDSPANLCCFTTYASPHIVERTIGIRRALLDQGFRFDETDFISVFSAERLDEETVDKLCQVNTYEVVICTSGVFAIPVIQALNRNGTGNVKKIVVFDDLELPPIEGATIWILRHADQEMGRICAQKLLNLIAGKPEASCRLPWRYREEGK